jgi:hypothetical protein
MDDMAMSSAERAAATASEAARFAAWCNCVRQLLGWREGEGDDWRALYASGHTPRDAARATVYGDTDGD